MSDYLPKFTGDAVTMTATADVIGGRLVEITTARGVAHTAAASTKYIGVAGHSAKTGHPVVVHLRGGKIQRGVTTGAVTVGAIVQTAADGKIAAGAEKIGIALTAATAAGQTIEYLD